MLRSDSERISVVVGGDEAARKLFIEKCIRKILPPSQKIASRLHGILVCTAEAQICEMHRKTRRLKGIATPAYVIGDLESKLMIEMRSVLADFWTSEKRQYGHDEPPAERQIEGLGWLPKEPYGVAEKSWHRVD